MGWTLKIIKDEGERTASIMFGYACNETEELMPKLQYIFHIKLAEDRKTSF